MFSPHDKILHQSCSHHSIKFCRQQNKHESKIKNLLESVKKFVGKREVLVTRIFVGSFPQFPEKLSFFKDCKKKKKWYGKGLKRLQEK